MKWKKLAFIGIVLTIPLLMSGFFYLFLWSKTDPLNPSIYKQIELGMTEEEVDKLILVPSTRQIQGNRLSYLTVRDGNFPHEFSFFHMKQNLDESFSCSDPHSDKLIGKLQWWENQKYRLCIFFDLDNKVIVKELWKFRPPENYQNNNPLDWFTNLFR